MRRELAAVLLAVEGGANRGDPCEAFAYHGCSGLESEVVSNIAQGMFKP